MKVVSLVGCGLLLAGSWNAFAGNVEEVQRYGQGWTGGQMGAGAAVAKPGIAQSDKQVRTQAQLAEGEVRELGSFLWSDNTAEVRELGSFLWSDNAAEVRELGSFLWSD